MKISKYKNIFTKGYMSKWSEEVFIIKKVENNMWWMCLIEDLNGEKID